MSEEHIQEDEEQTEQSDPKVEAEARDMGWLPQGEFKGDPDKWRPADEFVQRGKELLPIVNARLEKERKATKKLEDQIRELKDDFGKQIAGMKKATKEGLKAQRSQIEAEYESRKEKAVELGDSDAYKAAVKGEKEALQRLSDKADDTEEKAKKDAPQLSSAEVAFMDENAWYGPKLPDGSANPKFDATLTRWANTFADDVADEMPAASMEKQFEEIRERLEDRFPEKFGKRKSNGNGTSRVEGGSRVAGSGTGSTKWSQVPKEARAAADELIKEDGLFLEKGETAKTHLAQARERYAESFMADQKG